jgi:hypothetical protein
MGIWGEGDEERTASCRSVVEIEGAGRVAASLLVSCRPRFSYPMDSKPGTGRGSDGRLRFLQGNQSCSLPLVLPEGFGRGDQSILLAAAGSVV